MIQYDILIHIDTRMAKTSVYLHVQNNRSPEMMSEYAIPKLTSGKIIAKQWQ